MQQHEEEMKKIENERLREEEEFKEEMRKIQKKHEEQSRIFKEEFRKLEEEQRKKEEEYRTIRNQQEEEFKRIREQQEEEYRRIQIQHEEDLRRIQILHEEDLRRIQIQHEEDLRRFRMMLNMNIDIPSQAFDEEILKKLNKYVFNDDIKDKNGNIDKINCCICLNDIKKNDEVVKLPCNHIHHWNCCVKWLKHKSNCPMCRYIIKK